MPLPNPPQVNKKDVGGGFSSGPSQFYSGASVGVGPFHSGLGHSPSGAGLLGGMGGFSRQSYDISGSCSTMLGRDPNLVV